ncbi:DNA ligase-associated DEXH box helicase, partial [bacterium]
RILVGEEKSGTLVRGEAGKEIAIESLVPTGLDRFPWSGHLGTQMTGPVVREIAEGGSSLIFCNTRAQAELWFQAILTARPKWEGEIGLHHGSLDRAERDAAELGLKNGTLRAVVCTSSLDLGVDFAPVDRVLQIGSPKGIARLLQRAGRSGHRPGLPSRVLCVPTNGLELVDIAAAREAAIEGKIESRVGLDRPLDVLVQHLVTCALGGGFTSNEMLSEVRSTYAYRDLSGAEWDWCLLFIAEGGSSLRGYPEYHRTVVEAGRYAVEDKDIAMRHRMSIGTITADSAMTVQVIGGGKLGSVEESFLARLRPGDRFLFSGRTLEFVRVKDMTAWVKRSSGIKGAIPKWGGSRLPLSGQLADSIRLRLEEAKHGVFDSPEMRAFARTLAIQARWSVIPGSDEFLIERYEDREGHHLFFYPIEGRLVHEGLAALFATRISRLLPITFSIAANDYGFEILSATRAPIEEALEAGLLSTKDLVDDIAASLNEVELARRQFREIARVAGLTFGGFPGRNKSARQLQASSGLFYDVFARFDPENPLLVQAHREVLERQLEKSR